jgi:hypothetical protein
MLGIILSGVVHWDKSTSGYPPEGCDMRTIAKGLLVVVMRLNSLQKQLSPGH